MEISLNAASLRAIGDSADGAALSPREALEALGFLVELAEPRRCTGPGSRGVDKGRVRVVVVARPPGDYLGVSTSDTCLPGDVAERQADLLRSLLLRVLRDAGAVADSQRLRLAHAEAVERAVSAVARRCGAIPGGPG